MAPHSSILAGEAHGQRSLAGYSPWGQKELDTPERLSTQDIKHPSYKEVFRTDQWSIRRVLLWVQSPKSHPPKGCWLTEALQSCFQKSQSVPRSEIPVSPAKRLTRRPGSRC